MKKIYFSLLSLFTVLAASAQLTQPNNAPANGDTYDMYQCDTVSPGPAGANVVWNFAAANTHSSIIKTYLAQSVSTSTFPAANVAVSSGISDVSYLSSTTNTLGYYGGNIGVGAVTGNITYTSPAIYASYPMSLNTAGSSVTGGTLYISSLSLTGTFAGNSNVLVDGSGTITLPGGQTFSNTLRVVTTQTMSIVTSLANATVTQINYNYYASGIKAPVFAVSTATAYSVVFGQPSTTTQTFVTRNKNAVVTPTGTGVYIAENQAEEIHFGVFPNPSSSVVNFVTNSLDAKQVSIFDITGKLVEKQTLTEGKAKMDVSSYNKGLYLYSISTGEGRTLKSGKITVSQ